MLSPTNFQINSAFIPESAYQSSEVNNAPRLANCVPMFNPITDSTAHFSAPTQPSDAETIAKLGWVLIHRRWISPAQLQDVLSQQPQSSKKLGELLVEYTLISEGQLKQALREQYWRRYGYWVTEPSN